MLNYWAPRLAAPNLPYGVAEGDAEGDGEALASLFFLVVSFLVVPAVSEVDDFLVVDFLVIDSFFAGAFSALVVEVVADSFLVVHELMSPAANRTAME